MGLFGLSLVTTEELKILKRSYGVEQRAREAYRWFSGWKDLDILFDFMFQTKYQYWQGISLARNDYAIARGTDEYGRKTEGSP